MYIAHEVWPSGFAKDQSFKGPCAAPSTAGRIHASLERADCLFGAQRLGKQPRVANMLVEDYLRPAAAKAGILSWHRDDCGRLVEDDPRRFGFHDFATVSHRSWFASEPIPRRCKLCCDTAMSN
jgi:hypothetical protein